jgi:hypothetical protein
MTWMFVAPATVRRAHKINPSEDTKKPVPCRLISETSGAGVATNFGLSGLAQNKSAGETLTFFDLAF